MNFPPSFRCIAIKEESKIVESIKNNYNQRYYKKSRDGVL